MALNQALEEFRAICGAEGVLADRPSRMNRSRNVAPFPLHLWENFIPDAVILPRSTEEVAACLIAANRHRLPIVVRAAGTGYEGSAPRCGQVVMDMAKLDRILEVDPEDMTVTAQPSVTLMAISEALQPHGLIYPDDPGSFPCAFLGGRIGTSGWSLSGGRFGHARDLVLSFRLVLPTGKIIEVGDGGGRKLRKSSTGYQLKQLFMGHQGSLGVVTEATVEAVPKPEMEAAGSFAFTHYLDAWAAMKKLTRQGIATLAHAGVTGGPDMLSEAHGGATLTFVLYGVRDEVRPAAMRATRLVLAAGGRYLGDKASQEDWAGRHRVVPPLGGRASDGRTVITRYFFEDAAVPASRIIPLLLAWDEIVKKLTAAHEMFVPLGFALFGLGAFRPWAGCLTQVGVGFRENLWNERSWQAWLGAKAEFARVAIEHGGSISGAHGACRSGERGLLEYELGETLNVMKDIKQLLDPNNILNPGKLFGETASGIGAMA